MKKSLLLMGLLVAATPVFAGTKKIATINGVDIYRVKTCGLFCPSLTTIVAANPATPGEVSVLAHGANGGIVPSVAQAGGIVGGAALLRPARTRVSNEGGNAAGGSSTAVGTGGTASSSATGGSSTAAGGAGGVGGAGGGGFVPPGHQN